MKPYYEHDGIAIYHGDCREILPSIKANCVITDPPYTAAGGSSNGRTSETDYQFFTYWLSSIGVLIRNSLPPEGAGFLFCDWRTIGVVERAMRSEGECNRKAWVVSQALVWDREGTGMGSPFRNSFEMIAFLRGPKWESDIAKNVTSVLRHRWPYGRHEYHPSEKPVALCSKLVGWISEPGESVLDPFIGSGSVLLAARATGRNAIGIDIDERNCEIAARRLDQKVLLLDAA